jgi:flagellar protein FliO/FliZ
MVSSSLFLTAGWRSWARRFLVGLFASLVVAAPAADDKLPAAETVLYPRSAGLPAESTPGRSTNYATGLLVAVALAGAGGWLFWRGRRDPRSAVSRKLIISETKSLGNRQFLVVAAYEDKKFLLSVCPGRIELLTPLSGPTAPPAP